MQSRPEYVTNEHLSFLDDLRESAVINMFGAANYLVTEFGIDRNTARNILTYWMETFGNEDR